MNVNVTLPKDTATNVNVVSRQLSPSFTLFYRLAQTNSLVFALAISFALAYAQLQRYHISLFSTFWRTTEARGCFLSISLCQFSLKKRLMFCSVCYLYEKCRKDYARVRAYSVTFTALL